MEYENKDLVKEVEEQKRKIRNFDLVSDALKAEPPNNSFIDEFAKLIEDKFKKDLCEKERGSNDAENLTKLNNILKEMKLIASCPKLYSKSIGAIGGGFSSGKSSFINSFISGSQLTLAEGIMPVTAIPSYVISDQDSQVNGISFSGGLFTISLDMYNKISHEFMQSFDFDLKKIILYTTVLTPMINRYFENLCLIDTPGYNSPSSGITGQDSETARKYIENAEFLIWTVGIDIDGTISKSDIDFLRKFEFGIDPERHLYIVANKAQRKTPGAIESILDTFEKTLDDNDFQYDGISAYNSRKKEQLTHRKMDLFEFLEKHNKPSRKYAQLNGMLYDVFRNYFKEANYDFEEREKKQKEVKKLILRAIQSGNISIDNYDAASIELESRLYNLVEDFKPKEKLDDRLKRIENLRDNFMNCLNNFCDNVGIERIKEKYCVNCGNLIEGNQKFCPKCASELLYYISHNYNESGPYDLSTIKSMIAKKQITEWCWVRLSSSSKWEIITSLFDFSTIISSNFGSFSSKRCIECNMELGYEDKICPKCGAKQPEKVIGSEEIKLV